MSKVKEILSKLGGKAKMAQAALRGDAGVLATLEGEHAEVALLMKAVVDEGHDDRDPESLECRRELFGKIRVALLAHAKAEEQELYSTLERIPATREHAAHSEIEHRELEHLLRRLEHMSEADLGWMPTFASLQMKVEAHVEEEETSLFEQAKRVLSAAQLRDIDERYLAAKKRYEELLHAHGGMDGHHATT
jgi:hypothetical protein